MRQVGHYIELHLVNYYYFIRGLYFFPTAKKYKAEIFNIVLLSVKFLLSVEISGQVNMDGVELH